MAAAFAVLGFCCGICDTSGNALVAWSRPLGAGPALNALHMMFAVGMMLSPIVVDRSITATDSVWGVAVPLALVAVASSAFMLRHPSPARTRLDTVARSVASGARHLHVALVCAFFLVYVSLEMTFAGWIHTYVEQVGYGGATTATAVTVMFGAGFTLGRLVAIPVARRVSPGRILATASAMAVATSATFVVFDGPGAALWVITFAFAMSVAPQYASMMAYAESHLALGGREASAFVASSGVGLLVMPWLTGQLFDHTGPEALPWIVFVLALLAAGVLAVVATALRTLTVEPGQRPPATSSIEPVT
jgi:FHS family Na+ dependent glucose MFS transporter 1